MEDGAAQDFVDLFGVFDISEGDVGAAGILAFDGNVTDLDHAITERLPVVHVLNPHQFNIFGGFAEEAAGDTNAFVGDNVGLYHGEEGATFP